MSIHQLFDRSVQFEGSPHDGRNGLLRRQVGGVHRIAAFEDALYPSERFYLCALEPTAER
jgi:hypothetical protein